MLYASTHVKYISAGAETDGMYVSLCVKEKIEGVPLFQALHPEKMQA